MDYIGNMYYLEHIRKLQLRKLVRLIEIFVLIMCNNLLGWFLVEPKPIILEGSGIVNGCNSLR